MLSRKIQNNSQPEMSIPFFLYYIKGTLISVIFSFLLLFIGSLFCYFALAYGVSFGILKVSEILISKEGRINETVIVIVLALVSLMILVNRLLNGLRGKMCCSDNGCGCGNKNCANCPARDNCNHK